MHKLNIKSLPCIAIVSPIRSGGNLLNRLLDSHTELLTNHSETFLSVFSVPIEKSIYKIQRLEKRIRGKIDKKKLFQSLIFNDFKHKIAAKIGWTKTKYDNPINYSYNYKKHYKYFQDSLKLQSNYTYRTILDIYIISFFKSFGLKNIKKEINIDDF